MKKSEEKVTAKEEFIEQTDKFLEAIGVPNTFPVLEKFSPKQNEWFIESEADETMGIETFHYDNGAITKRCKLKDGRVAVCHLLKGKDRVNISRITGGDASKAQDAIVALATKINDKPIVIEDMDNMWFNDFTKVQMMATSINFM